MEKFSDILNIARDNVRKNPSIVDLTTEAATRRYLNGLIDETEEVFAEVKEKNAVFLADELSDIAWDYAVVLALLEYRGLIPSVEEVLSHAHNKYIERAPAFLEADDALWEEVKQSQKQSLTAKHQELYGN
jgi:NTP pyrophosphatase (non-canonical NTP hydrolase)